MRRIALSLSLLIASAASAAALTPEQLTPQEKILYDGFKETPADAQNFMTTREYVEKAKAVAAGAADATGFPSQPAGFDVKYLLPGESETISKAVVKSIVAMAEALFQH